MSGNAFLKRILDLCISSVLLVLLSPILLIVALLVRMKLGRPVLFRQERPGRLGVPFVLLKFRSMKDERDASGQLLEDQARLGSFGRWLRKTSLDELPELWNVLRGEMSLVGPRPLLMKYLQLYSEDQARRHEMKPGITGWAQVNGRNGVTWEDRFRLDVWYVDNWSIWLDFKILFMTVGAVFRARGITGEGSATMYEFKGSKKSCKDSK